MCVVCVCMCEEGGWGKIKNWKERSGRTRVFTLATPGQELDVSSPKRGSRAFNMSPPKLDRASSDSASLAAPQGSTVNMPLSQQLERALVRGVFP